MIRIYGNLTQKCVVSWIRKDIVVISASLKHVKEAAHASSSSYLNRQSVNPESIFTQLQAVETNEPVGRRQDSKNNRDLYKWKYSYSHWGKWPMLGTLKFEMNHRTRWYLLAVLYICMSISY
jgi:hypothetical protein